MRSCTTVSELVELRAQQDLSLGDDEAAKHTAVEFLDSIGYDAYDAGALSAGWRYQRDAAAYVQPYVAPDEEVSTSLGRQVTPAMLKEKLAAAMRHRDTVK